MHATSARGDGPGSVRLAVITDVHANLPALNVALEAIEPLGCDRIVHVGDAIGIGPFPAETLSRLLSEPRMQFVMGNHDAYFANGLPTPCPVWMSADEWAHQMWTHAAVNDADPSFREVVQDWPRRLDDEVSGVRVRWQHYGLAADGETFVSVVDDPDAATLDGIFGISGSIGAPDTPDVLFFGHHHPAMDLMGESGVRYVNPGALGTGGEGIARFAVLDIAGDGRWTVTHHAAAYDPEPVMRAFDEREVPAREEIREFFFGR
ncbi:MAG: metallophosphoesterase family protein [Thermomicrobiales bacterium]